MNHAIRELDATAYAQGRASARVEALAVEEPLEIRLGGRRFTVTMRTPGHDEELVAGFLLAEGFIAQFEEISEMRRVRDGKGMSEANVLDVILNVPAASLRERLKRNFVVSSSCGICGKSSIEALERRIAPLDGDFRIAAETILQMPSRMREAQQVFAATGGLHAAALFNGASLMVLREDIGRHNAVDKVIGHALAASLTPLHHAAMMVSGRLSFEIVQKAAAAGVPVLCAVSAPSSLAVELAAELGVTLIGFVRERNFNIYAHRERILV